MLVEMRLQPHLEEHQLGQRFHRLCETLAVDICVGESKFAKIVGKRLEK